MARSPRPPQGQSDEVPPTAFAETTPPHFTTRSYDFTLQAVMEMHRSVGELGAKVDRLLSDVASQGDKIDRLRIRMAWLAGAAAVVGTLIGMALVALRFLPVGWIAPSGI